MSHTRQRHGDFRKVNELLAVFCLCLVALPMMGCIGASAQIMNLIYGPEHPAKCGDLKKKRVAILVNADVTSFSSKSVDQVLERYISMNLVTKGKDLDIKVISTSEVERWRDNHPSDNSNLQSLGEAVDADFVLNVQMEDYDIRLGKTLFKGHCDYHIVLHDVKNDKVAFYETKEEHAFPANGGRDAIGTTEKQFQSQYLLILADEISRNFYPSDPNEQVALDSIER